MSQKATHQGAEDEPLPNPHSVLARKRGASVACCRSNRNTALEKVFSRPGECDNVPGGGYAGVAELADARDLDSCGQEASSAFGPTSGRAFDPGKRAAAPPRAPHQEDTHGDS
jgi:hypothetical protein